MTLESLYIALDISRLIPTVVNNASRMGIVRYVEALYTQLRGSMSALRVDLVANHPMLRPGFHAFVSQVDTFRRQTGNTVWTTWQKRRMATALFALFDYLEQHPIQASGKVLTPTMLSGALDRRWSHRPHIAGIPLPAPLKLIPWQLINGVAYRTTPFATSAHWHIYHSPFHPLPDRTLTSNAIRVLTVHDCLHIKHPALSPVNPPPAQFALASVDCMHDHIICVSEATRRDVLSLLPIAAEHVHTIPIAANGTFGTPDISLAAPVLAAERVTRGQYVLALAQSEARKNMQALILAFHQATQDTPELAHYPLVLVCMPGYERQLRRLVSDLPVPFWKYRILTNVDDALLASLYANATLFAYVSLYEGFGIPVHEAMQAGCPVLTSNTSSLPEVAGDAAVYTDPFSIDEITVKLRETLQQPDAQTRLVDRGYQQAARFSWEQTIAATIALYQELVDQPVQHHPQYVAV